MADAKDDATMEVGELEFASDVESELNEVKTSVLPPSQLSSSSWRHFLLTDVNQAGDHGLPWLVELLESVLASLERTLRADVVDYGLTEYPLSVCGVVTSGLAE